MEVGDGRFERRVVAAVAGWCQVQKVGNMWALGGRESAVPRQLIEEQAS